MKRKSMLFIIGALLVCSVFLLTGYIIHNSKNDNKTDNKYDDISKEKNTSFDLKFVKTLYNDSEDNLLYSPVSAAYMLSMIASGAKSNTLKEINYVLNNYDLTTHDNVEKGLSLTYGMWINEKYKNDVKSNFAQSLKVNYNTQIMYDSFENVININNWSSDNTYKIINIYDGPVTKFDSIDLININFISLMWKTKFDNKNNYYGDFYLKDGTTLNAEYFKSEEVYLDSEKYNGFAKEYENGFTFYALSPKTDINDLIDSFTVDGLTNSLTDKKALVSIPRFDFMYNVDNLMDGLKEMGLNEALLAEANYDLINKNLYLSLFTQTNLIDFKTDGTMSPNEIGSNDIEIKFEKPFVFVIKENNKDNIYFIGVVNKPVEIIEE